MLSINELKSGVTVLIDGDIYTVLDYHHTKPGKGAAFVRTRLRNLRNNKIIERTFKGDERIEPAYIDERKLQFLYRSGKTFHFMDQHNYEDISIAEEILGDNAKFLNDNLEVTVYSYEKEIINVVIPTFIEAKVIHAEPGIKGDTAKSAYKFATIETGARIQIPLFIQEGDIIKIDTRTGAYIARI